MHHLRKKSSSSTAPVNGPPPIPTSPNKLIKKDVVKTHSKAKDLRALAASSSSVASSIGSPSCNLSDASSDEVSKDSGWRTAYGAARMAVEIAKESSDMFLPLKAVVGALAVLIKNYDQTAANVEQMKEIEERIESLADVLASPVGDQDSGEKARREALRKKLAGIIAKLGSLSEQHQLLKFLKNVDHANALSGFVQDLTYAVTDYQTSVQQNTYENTRNIIEAADIELLGKLDPVHNAGHQAGHHDTCLRGTRESVLDGIMQWAKDPHDRHVFWLNGLAGTGKSTIAQTFSGMVAKNGILGASFFCSRDYLDRKELKNIFPTLAYQLACRYPAFRNRIITAIKRDPSIAHNSLISQLEDLIVIPLSSTGISCVIVVDALDECVDDQPASAILSVLGRFVKQLPSVKFFITGRPEPRIRTGFRLPLLEPFTQIFLLHEVELSNVDKDIQLYLLEKLIAVAKRRSDFDLSDPWPCDEDLKALTKKSSGLFIFASTLVRFIESEHHDLDEQLQLIVTPPHSTVHEGRSGIDPLYTQVLIHAFSDVKEDTVFGSLRRVLGAVILAFNPLSRAQIAKILNIKSSHIAARLRRLHSVLLVPNEDSKEIRVFHKSFPDFLQDPERCSNSNFFIASPDCHADIALGCLELLKKLKQNPCGLPDFVMNRDVPSVPELLEDKVGGGLRYACGYWAMHVKSSPTSDNFAIRLIASATDFFKNNALPWIEVMSLENRLEGVIHSINDFTDWLGAVDVSTSDLYTLAEDCLRFTMHFFHPIQQSAQHIYHSALPLSPKASIIHSSSHRKNTRIFESRGFPEEWGSVVRTIKGTPGGFTCMTVIGRIAAKIAAASSDHSVGIYDSVTGVLKLSLKPAIPIEAMTGSPDGSRLFCTHREGPSVTMWDIQTGGLTHTFVLKVEAKDTAISLGGRYLACALSDGSVDFWEVTNKTKYPTFQTGFPVVHLCWLVPEEQLVVANKASVHIWDVVAGGILRSFGMWDPVCGTAFSQELNRLVIITNSGAVTIVDLQTGSRSSYRVKLQPSCFAFSRTTKELVCGARPHGLWLLDVLPGDLSYFDHPATVTSVSMLSNGTIVANTTGFGIQLLRLNKRHAESLPPSISALAIHSFDEGRIIAAVPTTRDRVILLEPTTMLELHTIPIPKNHTMSTNHTAIDVILCALLDKSMAVHRFKDGDKENLQLWRFGGLGPEWIVEIEEPASAGSISLTGTQLVTFHSGRYETYIRVWDMKNGDLLAELAFDYPWPTCPLGITFILDDGFYFHHDTYWTYYIIDDPQEGDILSHSITLQQHLPSDGQTHKRKYFVDDNHEWVISDSQKICWIPPGYIGSVRASCCWAGSSLIMVGRDGILRALAFENNSFEGEDFFDY